MSIQIEHAELRIANTHTRMPFKYGIAALTAVPHLFCRLTVRVGETTATGTAADGLAPKWFTKNPETTFRHDIEEMLSVIRAAADHATAAPPAETPFALWQSVHAAQSAWAEPLGHPPLLWAFGVSLIERALIEAFCRATSQHFGDALRRGSLGLDLAAIHPELAGQDAAALLPANPLNHIDIRHTVGLADFLTDSEIPDAERVDDGLPQALEACVKAAGLRRFKIKVCGDPDRDTDRLTGIAQILDATGEDYRHTIDGNEQFESVDAFRHFWSGLRARPALSGFLDRMYFVEQPVRRDAALSAATGDQLTGWSEAPPMIIDESDGTLDAARRGLDLGYTGTSHKNCKGVFKGVANACLMAHRRRTQPDRNWVLSAEDLCTLGPTSLLQDLAVVASLGVDHVERNGHHYFRGLSPFESDIQAQAIAAHPDLYGWLDDPPPRCAALRINRGSINIQSVVAAPLGVGFEMPIDRFPNEQAWKFDSLGLDG